MKVVVALLAVAGCRETQAPDSGLLVVEPAKQWAGGQLWLSSPVFRDANVVVRLDSQDVPVAARAGGRVRITLPTDIRGRHNIAVVRNGVVASNGVVDVAGFREFREFPVAFASQPARADPRGGVASLIGSISLSNRIVQFLPGTGEFRALLDGYDLSNLGVRNAGISLDPDVLLFRPIGTSQVEAWRLFPTPVLTATYPVEEYRTIGQLNDSLFLSGAHHSIRVLNIKRPRTEDRFYGGYESTTLVHRSPRGDRMTIIVNGTQQGPPVFDTRTGEIAYNVSSLWTSWGVSFSPSGDTLYMLGIARGAAPQERRGILVALDATTGSELRRLNFAVNTEYMIDDPTEPWLYVLGPTEYPVPDVPLRVTVVDKRTLEVVGEMTSTSGLCYTYCMSADGVAGTDGLFIFNTATAKTPVWSFDRLTAQDQIH